jgi:prolipoprotein diacylglyceryl transferase
MHLLGSIPSPGSNAIHLGGLQLRAYGLMIALGVLAAVNLSAKRFPKFGAGTSEDVTAIAIWAVPAGVIGARLYHVITDWNTFDGDYLRMFKVWEGGLGIPGGMFLGVVVGLWRARIRGVNLAAGLTAAAPALPLAQAIGRLGNWWNQELYGRPSTLPWAVKIDLAHREPGYTQFATFHPTFLYESLWNLALAGGLIWAGNHLRLRPGRVFPFYTLGYGIGRLWIEALRIDHATKIAGLRVNEWTSLALILGSLAFFAWDIVRNGSILEPAAVPIDPPSVEA